MTAIAIDLGSTKVKLAPARPAPKSTGGADGRAEGCIAIPSCMYVSPAGEILSGDAAEKAIARNPAGAVRDVTTRFHRMESFPSNGHQVDRRSLLVQLLGDLRAKCELATGLTGPWECCMTVPAAFDTHRRECLAAAAERVGIAVTGWLENPIAVSHQWLRDAGTIAGTVAAICDIGGVTTELSLVQYRDGRVSLESRSPPTQLRMGGNEVDEPLWEMVAGASAAAAEAPELRRQLGQAKEVLAEGKLSVTGIAAGDIALAVTAEMVRRCCRPLAKRLRDELERFHRALGDGVSGPTPLVLAGGGSLLPGLFEEASLAWSRGPVQRLPHAGFATVLGAMHLKSVSTRPGGPAARPATPPAASRPTEGRGSDPFDNFD
jgi:molecular chaperone DnaK (HSP70)